MLPDFTKIKARAQRDFLRQVEQQVPNLSPLLKGVAKFRQHEGCESQLTRIDDSKSATEFRQIESTFTMTREEHKQFNPSSIVAKLLNVAKEIGAGQTRHMLEVAGKAADEVGNVVHANGEFTQETFLDIFRTVAIDFDPETLQIAPGFVWVMHPNMADRVLPKVKEWEKDAAFNAKYENILSIKREEWRDREARRKLVD